MNIKNIKPVRIGNITPEELIAVINKVFARQRVVVRNPRRKKKFVSNNPKYRSTVKKYDKAVGL